jgi:hypothetical protein
VGSDGSMKFEYKVEVSSFSNMKNVYFVTVTMPDGVHQKIDVAVV